MSKLVKVEENKLPVNFSDEYDGQGFEDISAKDLSIPFISILQANSPQVADDKPEGARPGMLFNTVTQELISGEEGIIFLPVHFEDKVVEWVPRDNGGGFVEAHDPTSEIVKTAEIDRGANKKDKLKTRTGNDLIPTSYAYGFILDPTGMQALGFTLIAFVSSKLSVFRKWKTALYMIKGKPALFKHRAKIKTVKLKNEKGTYYNFEISPFKENNWINSLLSVSVPEEHKLIQEAFEFRQMVVSGLAKVNYEAQNSAGSDHGVVNSDDVPF